MNEKIRIIFLILVTLFLASFVGATCTVELDKTDYQPLEVVTASMICDNPTEESQSFTLTWSNETGDTLETDTGTTPATQDTYFFETFTIPNDFSGIFNATLTGTNLEGTDFANVSGNSSTLLRIINASFSPIALIGNVFGVEFTVVDQNNKEIDGAKCIIYGTDQNDAPIQTCGTDVTRNGMGVCNGILRQNSFVEGNEYLAKITCSCGVGDNACFDEDGSTVEKYKGSNTFTFTISKWLTVNTVTDKSLYNKKQEIFICANVTSDSSTERVAMNVYHQVRCSSGADNDDDLDRALIISDDAMPDYRGINFNKTQMQCKKFVIPEARHLQGKSSECYASTDVWVLDNTNMEVIGYHTTSSVFNVTSSDINIQADWERIGDYTFNSIINLSDIAFQDYNAEGIGQIDIRLNKINTETVDHTRQYGSTNVDFDYMLDTQYIDSVSAVNLTGGSVETAIEFLEDGLLEIELRNVDMSSSGWYNVTLVLESFDERNANSFENHSAELANAADALEGIENKTGTFHFSITCPNTQEIGDHMKCFVNAEVEDSQTVQKEVDFTCYLDDGASNRVSEVNFNQMVTRSRVSVEQSFYVPETLEIGQEYQIRCEALYYNLGARQDRFFTSFVTRDRNGNLGTIAVTRGFPFALVGIVFFVLVLLVCGVMIVMKVKNGNGC